MKQIVYTASILASVLLVNCGPKMTESGSHSGENIALTDVDPMPFAESISPEELKEMLYVYASDEFEGRNTGEPGQKKAVEYLKDYYIDQGIPSALEDTYFQTVPESFFRAGSGIKASENVVAFIKGSTKPEEYVVISAHLDHVGVRDDGEVLLEVVQLGPALHWTKKMPPVGHSKAVNAVRYPRQPTTVNG